MAIVNRSTLKSYFKRLFKPTQENFENLIDSVVLQTDLVKTFSEKANQGEAEAGVDDTKVMTPVRVKDAILALANLATVPTLNAEVTTLLTALKNELIGGASDAMNTFKELETEILENEGGLTALSALIATKMAKSANGSDISDTKAFLENINTYPKEETVPIKSTSGISSFNTVFDTGIYGFNGNNFGGSLPDSGWGSIIVQKINDSQIVQTYYSTIGAGFTYKRHTTNGSTWTDWKELLHTGNMASQGVAIKGMIIMWTGITAPSGWALCNGSNGTPDLRGRFIVGYNPSDTDYNDIGKTGGLESVLLTDRESGIQGHTHGMSYSGSHTHNLEILSRAIDGGGDEGDNTVHPTSGDFRGGYISSSGSHIHSINYTQANALEAHENRPPYYSLAFIMKL